MRDTLNLLPLLRIAIILTGAFLLHPAHAAQPLADFDTFVEETRLSYGVPGVAVAVVKDGEVVFLQGFGVRKAGQPGAVDADTIFQLASVSKTFTSAAVGALVDEGKLGWDDPVLGYLPGFTLQDPYATQNTTLRDLLAHRTGLPAFTGDLLGKLSYDRAEVLRRIRYLKPATSFREVAAYSNLGFLTAGMVAGAVDGSSWENVVLANLLHPLDITRTGFSPIALSGTPTSRPTTPQTRAAKSSPFPGMKAPCSARRAASPLPRATWRLGCGCFWRKGRLGANRCLAPIPSTKSSVRR